MPEVVTSRLTAVLRIHVCALSLALTACSGGVDRDYGVSASERVFTNGPIPKGGGAYKLGSPYRIGDRWYAPREDQNYDRTGIASWYGEDFQGRKTANGEIYDMDRLSAAHPTLPLPSYAYVTNLANGRTVLVRVNDRGPYVNDRIIDLSRGASRALNLHNAGIGKVRVRYAGRAPLSGDDARERRYLALGYDEQASRGYADAAPEPYYGQSEDRGDEDRREDSPGWSPRDYRARLAGKAPPPERYNRTALGFTRDEAPRPQRYAENAAAGFSEGSYEPTSSVRQSGGRGSSWVDVGMFRDQSMADLAKQDFTALGSVDVDLIEPDGRGAGEWYRVRLGPFDKQEAMSIRKQVAERGFPQSAVVHD